MTRLARVSFVHVPMHQYLCASLRVGNGSKMGGGQSKAYLQAGLTTMWLSTPGALLAVAFDLGNIS